MIIDWRCLVCLGIFIVFFMLAAVSFHYKRNLALRMDSEIDDIIFGEELRENRKNSPLSIFVLLLFLGIGIWTFISWLSAPTPTPVSARTSQETQGISLLWSRELIDKR